MNPKPAAEELRVPTDLRKALDATYPDGEGSVEGSHADRAQGLYQLDRLSQTSGDT